jgi:hypothetical protein
MPTLITAAGASDPLSLAASNDGALTLQTGPSGGKVNALALDASGNGALLGALTQAGVATPRMQLMTAQNTTSGTSIDFTSIPSWVKKITVLLNGVSTNGANELLVQAGNGAPETSGYTAGADNTAGTGVTTSTAGFIVTRSNTAAALTYGQLIATNMGGNLWVYSSVVYNTIPRMMMGGGSKTFSGAIDRLRLTTVGGADTFDLGSVNLLLEGY